MCQVSKRMLRHYDEIELLKPYSHSQVNNYRNYHESQIKKVEAILLLQGFGFTLHEILDIYKQHISVTEFINILIDKQAVMQETIEKEIYNLTQIKKFMKSFGSSTQPVTSLLEDGLMKEGKRMKERDKLKVFRVMDIGEFHQSLKRIVSKKKDEYYYTITFDIDDFIHVNNDYGHDVGDYVIATTFSILEKMIHKHELNTYGIYARTGGDEFSLFISGIENAVVIAFVNDCVKAIASYDYQEGGCNKKISVTAGISKLKQVEDIRVYRHESYKALIIAKSMGKNTYHIIEN